MIKFINCNLRAKTNSLSLCNSMKINFEKTYGASRQISLNIEKYQHKNL